jgi:ABC-type transporter Mla subunit MlaD
VRPILAGATAVLAAVALWALLSGASNDVATYRVRAIFDSAANVIPGEDVKSAGVVIGRVGPVTVTDDKKAAIVLEITDPGFGGFREDASCDIRVQSLIGEKFVDCVPTQPRAEGDPLPPPLPAVRDGQPGAGEHLLPVTHTSSPVDPDLIGDVMRMPERQRFAIILNELGTGLAGRGDDLRAVVRRADPALRETDRVLAIVAKQDRVVADLATNSDRVLAPLARERRHVSGAIAQTAIAASGTAERRADLAKDFQKFPAFLRELSPMMDRLGELAREGTPVLDNLYAAAPGVNRFSTNLKPLSEAAGPWFASFGETANKGRTTIVQSKPAIDALQALAAGSKPALDAIGPLLASFRDTGGVEYLLDFIYNGTNAVNGFDDISHFLRGGLVLNACSTYSTIPGAGCSANFVKPTATTSSVTPRSAASGQDDVTLARTQAVLGGATPEEAIARYPDASNGAVSAPPASTGSSGTPDGTGSDQGATSSLLHYLLSP